MWCEVSVGSGVCQYNVAMCNVQCNVCTVYSVQYECNELMNVMKWQCTRQLNYSTIESISKIGIIGTCCG